MNTATPTVTLRAVNLTVSYDDSVALQIPELLGGGSTIAVLGHNGAGKSTLIKCLLQLIPPHSGSLSATFENGETIVPLTPHQHMAFCPETGSVFADLSVESYIRLWCRLKHGRDTYYREAEGAEILNLLSIDPLLRKLGRELSKGQRRRVQTAIGFLTDPKLFLFDEPFDGLDVQKTSELADIILEQRRKRCFVISSHRMDVIERLADFVIVLRGGKIAAVGDVQSVTKTLAGSTVLLQNVPNLEVVFSLLRERIRGCLVTHLGGHIMITGPGDLDPLIRAALADVQLSLQWNTPTAPSLTDAMNYHLHESSGSFSPPYAAIS